MTGRYDAFLMKVLWSVRDQFPCLTDASYDVDYPPELFWVLARALISEKGLTLRQAAQVVEEFCTREPQVLRVCDETAPSALPQEPGWDFRQ